MQHNSINYAEFLNSGVSEEKEAVLNIVIEQFNQNKRRKRIVDFLKNCDLKAKDIKVEDSKDLETKAFFMDLYEYFGLKWE